MAIPTSDAFEITAPRARQGYRGRRILWVLAASLLLVVAALFGTWGLGARQLAGARQPTIADPSTVAGFGSPPRAAPGG